jgi:general secretion pathway protein A
MYLDFYGLKEKPFSVTPDSSFLFRSRYHSEAFNHLLYGIKSKEGFILITGDIGTGKTTLCRALLSELGDKTHSALVFNPNLTETELLRTIIEDLGVEIRKESKKDLIDDLNRFLLACSEKGEAVIVIIDEAQNLSPEVLEEIRLLSNLETEKEKLLQIVLVGQTELQEKLRLPYLQQLNQRISVRYHLRPLEKDEVERYIHHRLMRAGSHGEIYFTPEAIRSIYVHSHGIPRIINLICDKALLAGYIAQKKSITGKMVRDGLADLGLESTLPRFNLRWRPGYAIASMLIILFLFILQMRGGNRGFLPTCQLPSQFAEARIPELLISGGMNRLQNAPDLNTDRSSREASDGSRESLVTLLKIWGIQGNRLAQELAFWTDDGKQFSFLEKARNFALEATVLKTDIEGIRALNYPCIVELKEKHRRSKHSFVTLTELTTEGAVIADPWEGTVTLPLKEFESAWTNLTVIIWRNFDGMSGVMKRGTAHPSVETLKKRLHEIGMLNNYQPDEKFDEQTEEAVKSLQIKYHLRDDGIVGSMTKMVLYRSLPFLHLPGLGGKGHEPDRKGA